jgi:single-strand DNA-binding protein
MKNVNKVYLAGNLGNDAELKTLASGNIMVKLRLATNESYNDKDGNIIKTTQWHNVVAWGPQADIVKDMKQGDYISLVGKLSHRSYEGKDGLKRYVTEVVMLAKEDVVPQSE